MKKTSGALAKELGLSEGAFEALMFANDFLDESGALTESGAKYCTEKYDSTGTVAVRIWDDSVLDEINVMPEIIEETDDEDEPCANGRVLLTVAACAAACAALAYGAHKCAPYVRRWWSERALPTLRSCTEKKDK